MTCDLVTVANGISDVPFLVLGVFVLLAERSIMKVNGSVSYWACFVRVCLDIRMLALVNCLAQIPALLSKI